MKPHQERHVNRVLDYGMGVISGILFLAGLFLLIAYRSWLEGIGMIAISILTFNLWKR